MTVGLTPKEQDGKCDICNKEKKVRIIVDPDKKIGFSICHACADKTELTMDEGLKKYGKKQA